MNREYHWCQCSVFFLIKKGLHPPIKWQRSRVHTQALCKRLGAVTHLIFSQSILFTLKVAVVI